MIPYLIFAQLGAVQLHASVTPDTVYVGQQVSYDAATLVDDAARSRLRTNPSYTPAEVGGATVYDFPFDTATISDVTIAGSHYRRYVYHRALFPLSAGTFRVPPSNLQYALPQDASYDSPVQTYMVQSEPATFVVRPLPASGRPLDFAGAVGQFTATARTDGATPRVGDTFVLTVRVNGVGNINLLPRPSLDIPWASSIVGEERVSWDSTGITVRGAKEFDWIITPKLRGEMIIPTVRYPYFDPSTRQYMNASTAEVKITVAPASDVTPTQSLPPDDPIGASPFPLLLDTLRANLGLSIAGGVVLLLLILGGILWTHRRHPAD